MITTTDTANIVYALCAAFGMPVYQGGNVPKGVVGKAGRVVVHAKEQTPETYWKKGFVEVNVYAADTPGGNADLVRLNTLEREAAGLFRGAGSMDGTPYRYDVASTSVLPDEELKAHFVNVKVLFKALNTL